MEYQDEVSEFDEESDEVNQLEKLRRNSKGGLRKPQMNGINLIIVMIYNNANAAFIYF